MRICLLTAAPDHPLLAATAALLAEDGHIVEQLTPDQQADASSLADVYLLKSRTPAALALAGRLEALGAPVVNSAASTGFCQDRVRMAGLADRAGLPFVATTELPDLDALLAQGPVRSPLVVKSRHSRRGDLVARVADEVRLRELAARWPGEPVVVQDLAPGSGWDHKLWVVAGEVFAELRHSELAPGERLPSRSIDELPLGWDELALDVGEVFGLDVYGVDILDIGGAPLIVDVNAFPGIRGQRGATTALARLALEAATGRHRPRVIVPEARTAG
ncbi:alpha-L-glutamate ligase [Kitasatospora sp. GP82]|uniref:ATP-grasp domain-containing protein n=1 Tax=Kitasatospora sp. GP82 TaxID=3035089 RepID=UPI002473975E|nr:alpha-L-glutamate ligase [Kitasatospora sp. GP82]MDH6128861.1 ribosomal protein S6--L-glutamate ligase [Kitasatospora sp. GP82]